MFPISCFSMQYTKSGGSEDFRSQCILKTQYHYFGVFDGHNGANAAQTCAELFPKILDKLLARLSAVKALEVAFHQADEQITDASGCTATVILTKGPYMAIANVGDSRAVLCREGRAIVLTADHNLDNPAELERIRASERRLKAPLITGRRIQGLMLTRSIGDHEITREIVAAPQIRAFLRTVEDQYVIIATDGLWDVCTSGEAVVVLQNMTKPDTMAQMLVDYALSQYRRRNLRKDDITVTIVWLQPLASVVST